MGREGEGFKIAMQTLDGGRIGVAAIALGIAQGAINETVKYVGERKQFGKRIAQFQNTQFKLAELQAKVDSSKTSRLEKQLVQKITTILFQFRLQWLSSFAQM